jgi:hypothetical protein
VYHAPPPHEATSKNEAVLVARRSLDTLQKERNITQEQFELQSTYGRTLVNKNIDTEAVQGFLDMIIPRQVAITKRIQELDVEIEKAQQALTRTQQNVHESARGEKRRASITATVLAETDGVAELLLTYGMFLIIQACYRCLTLLLYRRFQRILDTNL